MSSEFIVKTTYNAVTEFFYEVLGAHKMKQILDDLHKLFPNWVDLWSAIKKWLKKSPMTSMQHTIHSFAEIFPNYQSFADDLDNSLAIHPGFWYQVHENLCEAKEKL